MAIPAPAFLAGESSNLGWEHLTLEDVLDEDKEKLLKDLKVVASPRGASPLLSAIGGKLRLAA